MAQFFRTFESDTVGALPSDFTRRVAPAGSLTNQVNDISGVNHLVLTRSTAGAAGLVVSYDTPGEDIDAEVYAENYIGFSSGEYGRLGGIALGERANIGSPQALVGLELINLPSGVFLRATVNNNVVGGDVPFPATSNTAYKFRLRYESATTTVYGKAWLATDAEPTGWMINVSGWVWSGTPNRISVYSHAGTARFRAIGVGMGGDTAPSSGETTVDATIIGNARIELESAYTQDGNARIKKAVDMLQQGNARITATTDRPTVGNTRITNTTQRTIAGNSRIQVTSTRTTTGNTRLTASVNRGQTGNARVAAVIPPTDRTQSGTARINATSTRTQSGNLRVVGIPTSTPIVGYGGGWGGAGGWGRAWGEAIYVSQLMFDRDQIGTARILRTELRDQIGTARIERTEIRTIIGNARIAYDADRDQVGSARILRTETQEQIGNARIEKIVQRTIVGNTRIAIEHDKNQPGNASILRIPLLNQIGSALVAKEVIVDQVGAAFIIRVNDYTTKPRIGISKPGVGIGISVDRSRVGVSSERGTPMVTIDRLRVGVSRNKPRAIQ